MMPLRWKWPLVFALSVAFLPAACAGSSVRDPGDLDRADSGTIELPFRLEHHKIIIDGQVNGRGPMAWVLDTGMVRGGLINHPDFAAAVGLEHDGAIRVSGVGEGLRVEASMAGQTTLSIGPVSLARQTVLVMPADCLYSRYTRSAPFQGVVGYSLLSRYVVGLDYDRMKMTLWEPGRFSYAGEGHEIPMTLEATKPYIRTEVVLEGGQTVPVKLVVDTGAGESLGLNVGSSEALRVPGLTLETTLGIGVRGKRRGKLGRIEKLRLAGYEMDHLVTSFPDNPIEGLARDRHGILGNAVLERFNIIFDYARKRLILEPNHRFKQPFEHDMVGLTFRHAEDGTRTFEIDEVTPESPAAMAGIKPGDRILGVDARPVTEFSDGSLRALFKSGHGKALVLQMQRGAEVKQLKLVLRRMI